MRYFLHAVMLEGNQFIISINTGMVMLYMSFFVYCMASLSLILATQFQKYSPTTRRGIIHACDSSQARFWNQYVPTYLLTGVRFFFFLFGKKSLGESEAISYQGQVKLQVLEMTYIELLSCPLRKTVDSETRT